MTSTSNVCRCIGIYRLFTRYSQKEVIEIEIITVTSTDHLRMDENFLHGLTFPQYFCNPHTDNEVNHRQFIERATA